MAKALQPSICICRVIAIRYNRIDSHFSNVIRYYVILYHSIQQKILFICSSLKQSTIPTIEFVKTCISLIVLHPYNRSFDISNNMISSHNIFLRGHIYFFITYDCYCKNVYCFVYRQQNHCHVQ